MATQPLSESDITTALEALSGWERDGDSLTKTYKFASYLAGIAFASAVGVLSEGADHHPDMTIGWRKVTLSYSTHDAGNKISQKDVDLARAVDGLGYPKA